MTTMGAGGSVSGLRQALGHVDADGEFSNRKQQSSNDGGGPHIGPGGPGIRYDFISATYIPWGRSARRILRVPYEASHQRPSSHSRW